MFVVSLIIRRECCAPPPSHFVFVLQSDRSHLCCFYGASKVRVLKFLGEQLEVTNQSPPLMVDRFGPTLILVLSKRCNADSLGHCECCWTEDL